MGSCSISRRPRERRSWRRSEERRVGKVTGVQTCALPISGFDQAVYDFTFDQEKLNPPIDGKLFHFEAPKGAEIVEEIGRASCRESDWSSDVCSADLGVRSGSLRFHL